jgi:lipid A 3-O-deacylase
MDTRLVAHDIFLDGNTFRNSHSVEKEPVVSDLSTGVAFTVSRWKYSIAHVYRTKEFDQQDHAQSYGSLTLSYSW